MRLTPRDIAMIGAIHAHRVLRRDQVQRLLFSSKNTANERLKIENGPRQAFESRRVVDVAWPVERDNAVPRVRRLVARGLEHRRVGAAKLLRLVQQPLDRLRHPRPRLEPFLQRRAHCRSHYRWRPLPPGRG